MAFAPKVHKVEINDQDETETFFVREATMGEVIDGFDRDKRKNEEKTASDNVGALHKYLVHEDGSALSADELKALRGIRLTAGNKLNEAITVKSGIGKAPSGDEEKKG